MNDTNISHLNSEREDLFNYYALEMLKIQSELNPTADQILRVETLFVELFKFHAEKLLHRLSLNFDAIAIDIDN